MMRSETTELVRSLGRGDEEDREALFRALYDQLRGIAAAHLGRDARRHTLQPTALVHEAWTRLVDAESLDAGDRQRFLMTYAKVIRQVLVDHARGKGRIKRGGAARRVTLVEPAAEAGADVIDLLALDGALEELRELDEERANLVELHFFAGMTLEESAAALGIPARTADVRWRATRAWLQKRLSGT